MLSFFSEMGKRSEGPTEEGCATFFGLCGEGWLATVPWIQALAFNFRSNFGVPPYSVFAPHSRKVNAIFSIL
jgi:hypothetical protein